MRKFLILGNFAKQTVCFVPRLQKTSPEVKRGVFCFALVVSWSYHRHCTTYRQWYIYSPKHSEHCHREYVTHLTRYSGRIFKTGGTTRLPDAGKSSPFLCWYHVVFSYREAKLLHCFQFFLPSLTSWIAFQAFL